MAKIICLVDTMIMKRKSVWFRGVRLIELILFLLISDGGHAEAICLAVRQKYCFVLILVNENDVERKLNLILKYAA